MKQTLIQHKGYLIASLAFTIVSLGFRLLFSFSQTGLFGYLRAKSSIAGSGLAPSTIAALCSLLIVLVLAFLLIRYLYRLKTDKWSSLQRIGYVVVCIYTLILICLAFSFYYVLAWTNIVIAAGYLIATWLFIFLNNENKAETPSRKVKSGNVLWSFGAVLALQGGLCLWAAGFSVSVNYVFTASDVNALQRQWTAMEYPVSSADSVYTRDEIKQWQLLNEKEINAVMGLAKRKLQVKLPFKEYQTSSDRYLVSLQNVKHNPGLVYLILTTAVIEKKGKDFWLVHSYKEDVFKVYTLFDILLRGDYRMGEIESIYDEKMQEIGTGK